jgi:hypothetical protein
VGLMFVIWIIGKKSHLVTPRCEGVTGVLLVGGRTTPWGLMDLGARMVLLFVCLIVSLLL